METTYFYDTCALLNVGGEAFKHPFIVSPVTLEELDHIKTSANKDEITKELQRNVSRLLKQNKGKYQVVSPTLYDDINSIREEFHVQETNDNLIIASVVYVIRTHMAENIVFCTDDINANLIASTVFDIPTVGSDAILGELEDYTGYKDVDLTDDELGELLSHPTENTFGCLPNQYLVIHDPNNIEVVDALKWTGAEFVQLQSKQFDSYHINKDDLDVRTLDIYQKCALDSMLTNQVTVMRGAAGTGKTWLGFSYLVWLLDTHQIEKIYVACNTVASKDSAQLGFYPGTKDEKVLGTNIGGILSDNLGDRIELESMIQKEQIELLPMCDARGRSLSKGYYAVYMTEAENMTVSLMQLLIQRLGENTKCILEGDNDQQLDRYAYYGYNNGMRRASEVLRGSNLYGEVKLPIIHRSTIAGLAQKMTERG